jgi:hypothetical protein
LLLSQGRLMRMYDDFFSSLDQPIAQVLLTRENLAAEHHCALCARFCWQQSSDLFDFLQEEAKNFLHMTIEISRRFQSM